MAEILHHLGCIKPYKQWDKLPINWCRISAINSITNHLITSWDILAGFWIPFAAASPSTYTFQHTLQGTRKHIPPKGSGTRKNHPLKSIGNLWVVPQKGYLFKRNILIIFRISIPFLQFCDDTFGLPPTQDASHKWRFRLGFPILKIVHNPGGDDCLLLRFGVVPNDGTLALVDGIFELDHSNQEIFRRPPVSRGPPVSRFGAKTPILFPWIPEENL